MTRCRSIRSTLALVLLLVLPIGMPGCGTTPREQYRDGLVLYNATAQVIISSIETGVWKPTEAEKADLAETDLLAVELLGVLKAQSESGDPGFQMTRARFLALIRQLRLRITDGGASPRAPPTPAPTEIDATPDPPSQETD